MASMTLAFATCVLLFCRAAECFDSYPEVAHNAYPSAEQASGMCSAKLPDPNPEQRQHQQGKRRFTDLTHEMRADLPAFDEDEPVGEVVKLVKSMDDGFDFNFSETHMVVHTGTHLDAPGHFVDEHYKAGLDVSTLDLDVLVGPVLIVDAPRSSNITAEVMQGLGIPPGVRRVLFRTLNTDRRLMWKPQFDSSYTGFTTDGADWLVRHRPEVQLVGIDYLSVAAYDNLRDGHRALQWEKLVLVEGLNLDDAPLGLANLYCLPIRLLRAEGCPVRCILADL